MKTHRSQPNKQQNLDDDNVDDDDDNDNDDDNNNNNNHFALQPFTDFGLLSQVSPSSSIPSCFLVFFNFKLF
jgi:hypothetical protein